MRKKLRTEEGKELYLERMSTVEPVFGQMKQNRGFTEFLGVEMGVGLVISTRIENKFILFGDILIVLDSLKSDLGQLD